ncbi:PepSY domain-containing protein [Jeotgalibaca caeni]|uniref:PepSY domain-containing protein n=1 Tax=Jeotgalibaca caeni TaxID=3028623 RepID=UPI00237ECA8E|nr:PepSY domain-containing protein [Jeotgalibaca caeni]MDE1548204.1 PepSY domain-containing protein [Jeotgalibaca caeni]
MMKNWKVMSLTGLAAVTLAACGDTGTTETPTTEEATSETLMTESQTSETASMTTTDSIADTIPMTEALDVYWAEYPDAQIEQVDFDSDRSNWTYEITGVFENREYEMEIDAMNGEVLRTEEDDTDNDESYLTFDHLIDPEEAVETARQEVAEDATFEGWNLSVEDDQDRPEYDIEFGGTDDQDVTIHAETGEVLEVDH